MVKRCVHVILLFIVSVSGFFGANCSAQIEIRIPPSLDPIFLHRNIYSQALLENALIKSGVDYRIIQSDMQVGSLARLQRHIAKGVYDVSWMHTSPELEGELLPIRIPIFKGIIGWRIAFIRPENKQRLANIKDISDLAEFTAVQGLNWPDVDVLENSHLKVRLGVDLPNIRQLLINDRADYFPRSICEIWDEEDYFRELGAIVEESFAIHYPSAVYFFVSPQNAYLAEAIKIGLEASLVDGSFDQLFFRFFGDAIDRANLPNRRVIYLENPFLPKSTPLDRSELWFQQND